MNTKELTIHLAQAIADANQWPDDQDLVVKALSWAVLELDEAHRWALVDTMTKDLARTVEFTHRQFKALEDINIFQGNARTYDWGDSGEIRANTRQLGDIKERLEKYLEGGDVPARRRLLEQALVRIEKELNK